MPLQLPQFGKISFEEANPFLTGMSASQQLIGQLLKNYFAPQMMQADLSLKNAESKRQEALSELPFGGQTLPGPAGQIMGLESVRQQYGEDSPQYRMAKGLFDLSNQSVQSRINYQNTLANNPERFLTTPGKTIIEEANVREGLQPGGQPWSKQLSADMPSSTDLADQYALLRQKSSSDTDTRKRNLFATNIEKTLDMIDPESLTQYSGLAGTGKKGLNQLLASVGKESKSYDEYLKSKVAADTLAKQVRQFYGDSIQPQMEEKLNRLTDPSFWASNPKLAKQNFLVFKDILSREMKTYREAVKSPSVYQGKEENQESKVRKYNPMTGRIE